MSRLLQTVYLMSWRRRGKKKNKKPPSKIWRKIRQIPYAGWRRKGWKNAAATATWARGYTSLALSLSSGFCGCILFLTTLHDDAATGNKRRCPNEQLFLVLHGRQVRFRLSPHKHIDCSTKYRRFFFFLFVCVFDTTPAGAKYEKN